MGGTGDTEGRDGQNVGIVHDRLREEILSGKIPAGATSQVALAQELGVGRTPLREALRLLQHEGLVISEPNRRVRVAGLSAGDAEDVYVMRLSLEASAVRMTVPTLGSAGIAELEGLLAQMDHYVRSGDEDGLRAPHRAFHARLVAAAGERMTTAISQLSDHAERYRLACGDSSEEDHQQCRAEHRGIVDAMLEADPDLAVTRLVDHYRRSVGRLIGALDPGHDPVRLRVVLASLAPGSEPSLAT